MFHGKRILEIFSDDAHRIEVGKVAAKTIPITFDTMVDRTLERYRYLIAKRKESEGKKKRTVRKSPQRRVKNKNKRKRKKRSASFFDYSINPESELKILLEEGEKLL